MQSCAGTSASRATSLEGLSPLHDKTRDLFFGRREGVQAYCVYVDSLGVIANTRQEAEIVLKQWRDLFTENRTRRTECCTSNGFVAGQEPFLCLVPDVLGSTCLLFLVQY